MARVIGPNSGMRGIDLPGGPSFERKNGVFEVPDRMARSLADAIGGGIVGTRIRTGESRGAPGPWCQHGLRPFYCPDCEE